MNNNNYKYIVNSLLILCISLCIIYSIYSVVHCIRPSLLTPKPLHVKWEGEEESKPWPSLPGCENFVTQFAKQGNLPTRALVSYPGSGNTWLRYLIEEATGIYTWSVYISPVLIQAGYSGEGRPFVDGSIIVQKTHQRYQYNAK